MTLGREESFLLNTTYNIDIIIHNQYSFKKN